MSNGAVLGAGDTHPLADGNSVADVNVDGSQNEKQTDGNDLTEIQPSASAIPQMMRQLTSEYRSISQYMERPDANTISSDTADAIADSSHLDDGGARDSSPWSDLASSSSLLTTDGNSSVIPSVRDPSMVNVFRCDDDDDSDAAAATIQPESEEEITLTNELNIKVDQPEKIIGMMDTYVTYRITTKTKRSDFMETAYEVRRRYSDFLWLRQQLEHEMPFLIIPPLPEKHSVVHSLDRFEPPFVKARCYLLHLFAQALALTPRANRHRHLRAMLTLDPQTFAQYRKEESVGGGGSNVAGSIYHFATSKWLQTNHHESEFACHYNLCNETGQTLTSLEKMATKVQKSEAQLCQDIACYQIVAEHWSEQHNSRHTSGTYVTLNNRRQSEFESESESTSARRLQRSVTAVSSALAVTNAALDHLCDQYELSQQLPWKHWQLYVDVAKTSLKRRDRLQWELLAAKETLVKKNTEKEQHPLPPTPNNQQQKPPKLEQQIEELRAKVSRLEIEGRDASVELRRELNRWGEARDGCLTLTIESLCQQRVAYYETCLEAWKSAAAACGDRS